MTLKETMLGDDGLREWPGSLAAWQRSRKTLAGGVSTGLRASMPPHPLFFESGDGSRLRDVDGNTYIDFVLGWGPLIAGHSHPLIVQAVGEQLARGQTFGAGHRLEFEVAERLCDSYPGAERVLWSNTGSEAVQVALRLARASTGRRRFLKFEGHYHGWHDSVLISYRNLEDGTGPVRGSAGQPAESLANVTVARFNDLAAVVDHLGDAGEDIAAVIVEPVLCNTGVIKPAEGFLEGLRDACNRTGTVLIFDEVITGFRIARGGAAERFGVVPDLAVFAKALAGGFSLSAIAGKAAIVDLVQQGVVHAGTYNGNPIALAAASATLDILDEPGVYERMESLTASLADGLSGVFAAAGVTSEVHHVGPVLQLTPGMESVSDARDVLKGDWGFYDDLMVAALRRGIFLLPGGRLYLSTAHTNGDVAQTIHAFRGALDEVLESGRTVAQPISS